MGSVTFSSSAPGEQHAPRTPTWLLSSGGSPVASANRKPPSPSGHSLLVIAYHVLRDEADYHELGGDFFVRRTDTRFRQQRLVRQLEQLGNRVILEPVDT